MKNILEHQDNLKIQFGTDQEKYSFDRDEQKTTIFTSDVLHDKGNVSHRVCHLKDGDRRFWNCLLFKKTTAKKKRSKHQEAQTLLPLFENRTSSESMLVEEIFWHKQLHKKQNRLLHRDENTHSKCQTGESSTIPVFTANGCSGSIQMVLVQRSSGAINFDTLAVYDTRSTLLSLRRRSRYS